MPGHSVSAHEAEECVEAPAFAAALDVSCADGVGLIARVTEFVARRGCRCQARNETEGAPHGGTQLFSLSGVMLSKDRTGRCLNPTSRRWRRGSLAARRVDGVAARVSRRSSRRWRGGAGLSSPVASMASWVSRRLMERVNEAKLARGFKDELEMGVNIDMCVYDDAEAVKMAAWVPGRPVPRPARVNAPPRARAFLGPA